MIGLLVDIVFVVTSMTVFFFSGWTFYKSFLSKDYEIKQIWVHIHFSVVFALSISMFQLIICEILGFLQKEYVFLDTGRYMKVNGCMD